MGFKTIRINQLPGWNKIGHDCNFAEDEDGTNLLAKSFRRAYTPPTGTGVMFYSPENRKSEYLPHDSQELEKANLEQYNYL